MARPSRTSRPPRRVPIPTRLALGLALLTVILSAVFTRRPDWGEIYSRYVFGVLRLPFVGLHRILPFSLTEITAALLVLSFIPAVILGLRHLIRLDRSRRLPALGRFARRLLTVALLAFSLYMLFHGLNFRRESLFVNLGLEQRKYAPEELYEVTAWIADELNAAHLEVERDADGYFRLNDDETVRQALKRAPAGYTLTSETTDLIHEHSPPMKPVLLSRPWAYTGITGMYFPLWVEGNVNIDTPPDQMLFTAQHELAHTQGFAREDEANYLAYSQGIRHPDADYRYAAWLSTYIYFNNATLRADREVWGRIYDGLEPGIKQDLGRRSEYWKQFETPVKEVSTKVNNRFLKVNRVPDGTKSYGRMMDLVMAEYFADAD